MNAVDTKTDPRIARAIALVREAIDEVATTPDDGATWEAKQALLGSLQWLVRARNAGRP
jgi:hypothetical protein